MHIISNESGNLSGKQCYYPNLSQCAQALQLELVSDFSNS